MKKYILLILALAVLCCALCACSDGGNVTENDGSVVTDNANDNGGDNGNKGNGNNNGDNGNKGNGNNLGDDIENGVDDIGDDIEKGVDDVTHPDASPQQPKNTAVPGTQAVTP